MANTKKYVSLDKLGLYNDKIKDVISNGDKSTLAAAEAYADGLAENYDAAGSAATAEANAKSYTDGKIEVVDGVVAGVKTTAEQGVADAATAQAAAEAAQDAADAAQEDVDNLADYVGTIPSDYTQETVIAYINKKAEETLAAAQGGSSETAASVKAALDTYKTENDKAVADVKVIAEQGVADAATAQAAAAAAQEDIDTFVEQTYATDKAALEAEDARIAGLVATEQERAEGVEADFEGRISAMEAFFEGAASDEGEGENLKNALDTLKEIQEFATGEGTAAAEMLESIAANTKAISDMDTAYKAADATINGRLDVLEAIDHNAYVNADATLKSDLEGKIALKADASALTDALAAQATKDGAQDDKIAALEAKFTGEGSVEDMIADAKQEAIDTAAGDASTKAGNAETAAKGYADELNTAMNTRVEALEAIDHSHANQAELDLIAAGDKAKWDAAAAIAHEHGNKTVLDGITAENITTWNTVTSKAAQSDLTAVSDRVTAIETWHANFVEVSEQEIKDLFA